MRGMTETKPAEVSDPPPPDQGEVPRALPPLLWLTALGSYGHGLGAMIWTALAVSFTVGQSTDLATRTHHDFPPALVVAAMAVALGIGVFLLRGAVPRASQVVRLLGRGTLTWAKVIGRYERDNATLDPNADYRVNVQTDYFARVEFRVDRGGRRIHDEKLHLPRPFKDATHLLVLYSADAAYDCRLVDQLPGARIDESGRILPRAPYGLATWLIALALPVATAVFAVRFYMTNAIANAG